MIAVQETRAPAAATTAVQETAAPAVATTAVLETAAPASAGDIKLTVVPKPATDVAPTAAEPHRVDPPAAIASTPSPAEKPAAKRAVAARQHSTATRERASLASARDWAVPWLRYRILREGRLARPGWAAFDCRHRAPSAQVGPFLYLLLLPPALPARHGGVKVVQRSSPCAGMRRASVTHWQSRYSMISDDSNSTWPSSRSSIGIFPSGATDKNLALGCQASPSTNS
jgi:hypothetical protein